MQFFRSGALNSRISLTGSIRSRNFTSNYRRLRNFSIAASGHTGFLQHSHKLRRNFCKHGAIIALVAAQFLQKLQRNFCKTSGAIFARIA
jgi:hypothetical protein